MFINAGQAVDEGLVNALIKEVLQEKMQTAVGQRTTRDDEGMVGYRGQRKQKPTKVITVTPRTSETAVRSPSPSSQVKRVPSPPVVSLRLLVAVNTKNINKFVLD